MTWWLPGGSDGKASAYNAGDTGSIPGSGRSPGEGNGNPLQYSCPPQKRGLKEIFCSSLVASRLKHLPGMWETRVQSLGWEDPLEKEMATHSSTLAWRITWREEPGRLQSMWSQRVGHDWVTHTHTSSGCQFLCSKVILFLFQFYWETIEIYPCLKFLCTEWWLDLHVLLNVLSVDLVSIH